MGFRSLQTVLRRSGGEYDEHGYWQEGTQEEITVMASVQPLTYLERARLSEGGYFLSEAVKVYSDVPLIPSKQAQGDNEAVEGDKLVWQGKEWLVMSCDAYQMGVIPHYKSIAQEVSAVGQNEP